MRVCVSTLYKQVEWLAIYFMHKIDDHHLIKQVKQLIIIISYSYI